MEGISLANVNATAPAMRDQGEQSAVRRAGQDAAGARAPLTAVPLPTPQLAASGTLGTQLDAWA